ncbi:mobA/MobL family protein, partial [Acinetobacter baumannii 6112]
AENKPKLFWKSADQFEISRGRTSSTLTIALPKELILEQRAELVQKLIDQFAGQYQFPYTAVIHNHPSEITGEDQPHLHLMYSERTISDDIERPPEQFFKQYRPKKFWFI